MAGSSSSPVYQWPFAAATVVAPASAATYDITVSNRLTFINLTPSAAGTLTLTAGQGLEVGARVKVKVTQGGTGRNITLSTGITAPNLTGVASDIDTIELLYDGTTFAGGAWAKVLDFA